MLPDRVSNPEPLTYESGALPTALRGPACDPWIGSLAYYPLHHTAAPGREKRKEGRK